MRIDNFEKEPYKFLSNFYPCHIRYEGIDYPSVEHAYQAAKTTVHEDRVAISLAKTPGAAKKMGRRLKCRKDWDDVKWSVMRNLLKRKFLFHKELADKLLETGDAELIEGNWWGDTYWGVCKGVGKNQLGMLLMYIRSEVVS